MRTLWTGTLRKMRVAPGDPVAYRLADGGHDPAARAPDLPLNGLIGRRLVLRHTGDINCTACGRAIKKTFGQGYCYPCSQSLAEADICIVRPELCHYFDAANPCRDEDFAQAHCFRPHVLYVALTSGFKVGITRRENIPTRWIDQGAVAAVPLAELPSRREVGLVEHELSQSFNDKTHWMRMLKESRPDGDVEEAAARVLAALAGMGVAGVLPAAERIVHEFRYPVRTHPAKVRSFNLDKDPEAAGELLGIKGQYLIFDAAVINLRKYAGYRAELLEAGA